ncbi:MAG: pyruvate dehydrogenase complex dihydrolipoamide acetyltransferase [Hyphomicrobiaceae bacterium]|nr:pyruvate dehydrogenase complex dihydrolipoamide acetyltransferase [Hyphomicrobiaceae bacterium]
MSNILMPALSPTMEEGKLAKWLVKEGQRIKAGDVIAEIETDKATMEVEASEEGTVSRILVAAGTEGVKVNTPIAELDGEAASPSPRPRQEGRASPSAKAEGEQHAQAQAAAPLPAKAPAAGPPRPAADARATSPAPHANGHARVAASPLARRLARDAGLDIAALSGSGPHGRIVKRDVEAAQAGGTAAKAAPAATTAVAQRSAAPAPALAQPMPDDKILALYDKSSYEIVPHDGMRRVIAQRLTQAKQTIPHFYLTLDCRLDALLSARERLNKASPKDGPRAYRLSVNDFVIKALALALQQVPAANVTWTEQGMVRHKYSDVGVAVAVEGGLFTPVIRHAEMKTLSEISHEMKDLAERARKRRLAPHEYQGGTTSISNLGMYGITSFDAVINPPHATILAVGAGDRRPIAVGDRIEIGTVMSCTLSCDHRAVDGAVGAELLGAFRQLIEDPVRMLI